MIALLAVVLSISPQVVADNGYSQTVLASAPLAARGEVEIDDTYGDIAVSPGDAGIVKVQAVKHAGSASGLGDIDVHVDAIEGAVKVSTDFPPGWSWFHHSDHSVDYTVRVPPGTRVILRQTYGDGTISHVGGSVDAVTKYGDLKVDGAAAPAILDTEYGDVELSLSVIAPSQDVTMHTTYGDVDLTMPASAAPRIHAVTHFGDVENDFESTSSGPSVDLRTTFGDVNVRKGNR